MLTYRLPKELIAKYPSEPRDTARLLVLQREGGEISHRVFRDFPKFLKPGDCLVLNDTQVIPARLWGRTATGGGKVELLVLRQERDFSYRCLGRPGKRLRPGTRLLFNHGSVQAEVISGTAEERLVRFQETDPRFRGDDEVFMWGEIPLPPYIRRPVQPEDAQWYQTVYARCPGAVAAPTAGLHFTPELLDQIRACGVRIAFVTLHVGWGTFKPVGEEELREGRLHGERFRIPEETLQAIRQTKAQGKRVIAVGTTVVRALESDSRWSLPPTVPLKRGIGGGNAVVEGVTDLFIRQGFQFKGVDGMITNFHLPGTSLLYLVAAFAGEKRILAAYQEAIRQGYRFYSYGDAMFIQ